MNKTLKNIPVFYLILTFLLFAFEQDAVWIPRFSEKDGQMTDFYDLCGNPAAKVYRGNIQSYTVNGSLGNYNYHRIYDPLSDRNIAADFTALMQINEGSFFQAGISYDDYRQQQIFASMEKDFYNDYFSMIDSTTGDVAYYGPQLNILYNVRLTDKLYLGLEGNYGIERSLKDTFPKTITIMRNSAYRAGLEYRGGAAAIGIFGQFYDNQKHYEAVKEYSEVEPKTYFGYNVYYNELSSSKSEKVRNRSGLEYGLHFRLGRIDSGSLRAGISGFKNMSKADLIRGSHTHGRGLWQREGLHLFSKLNIRPQKIYAFQFYADYLNYNDWGASNISNTLILENKERFLTLGMHLAYRPSMLQQIYAGVELHHVSYAYTEYIFPFYDERKGWEWELNAGGSAYVSAKDCIKIDFVYGTEIPRFYWGTEAFENLAARISLEHLFSFGYIKFDFKYNRKKPINDIRTINIYAIGLSYYWK